MNPPISSTSLITQIKSRGNPNPMIEPVNMPQRTMHSGGEHGDAPPALHQSFSPAQILSAVRRRWREGLALGLLLGLIAAAVTWILRPEKYTSYCMLRIYASDQRILSDNQHVNDSDNTYLRTQLASFRQRQIYKTALNNEAIKQLPILAGKKDPIDWLGSEIKVEQIDNTEFVRVSLTSREHPNDLAPLVNAVVKSYMNEVQATEKSDNDKKLLDLQTIHGVLEQKVVDLRKAISDLARDLQGGDGKVLTLQQQTLLSEYSQLQTEIAKINSLERELDVKLKILQLHASPKAVAVNGVVDPANELLEKDVSADPKVAERETAIAHLQSLIKDYEDRALPVPGPHTDKILSMKRELDAAQIELQKLKTTLRTQLKSRYSNISTTGVANMILELQEQIKLYQAQRQDLKSEVDKKRAEFAALGVSTVELELKRGDLERTEQFRKSIWEQKERIELEKKGTNRDRVKNGPVEDAMILNKSNRIQETAGAGAAGLCLGLLIVGYWDSRRGRIYQTTDVTRGLRMRVVGCLPILPRRPLKQSETAVTQPAAGSYYGNELVESIDAIRTMLIHEYSSSRGSIIMVGSALSGEGKTTLAAHLASSLARAGSRTLLVDCDLRAPSLHTIFSLPLGPGMCDLLVASSQQPDKTLSYTEGSPIWSYSHVTLDEAIRPTAFGNLHVLTAGELNEEAGAAMAQPTTLQRVFSEIRGRYDFVIVDSSPAMLIPDALMFARCADGLLYSVRPGVSQASEVHQCFERFREYRLPFIGVVINGISQKKTYLNKYARRYEVAKSDQATPAS